MSNLNNFDSGFLQSSGYQGDNQGFEKSNGNGPGQTVDDPVALASTITWALMNNAENGVENGAENKIYTNDNNSSNLKSQYDELLGTSDLDAGKFESTTNDEIKGFIESTYGTLYTKVAGRDPTSSSSTVKDNPDSLYNNFLERSKTLMDLNEAVNSTRYVNNIKEKEHSEMDQLANNILNEKYRKMLKYRTKDYRTHLYKFITQLVVDFILLASIIFIIVAFHFNPRAGTEDEPILSYKTTLGVSLLVAIVFTLIMVFRVRHNLITRRPYNWDRHYWSAMRDTVRDCYII